MDFAVDSTNFSVINLFQKVTGVWSIDSVLFVFPLKNHPVKQLLENHEIFYTCSIFYLTKKPI